MLLNDVKSNQMREQIEEINERVSNNQYFNTKFAGELYNQLLKLQYKQLLGQNATARDLEIIKNNVKNNQITIPNEQQKLTF